MVSCLDKPTHANRQILRGFMCTDEVTAVLIEGFREETIQL